MHTLPFEVGGEKVVFKTCLQTSSSWFDDVFLRIKLSPSTINYLSWSKYAAELYLKVRVVSSFAGHPKAS